MDTFREGFLDNPVLEGFTLAPVARSTETLAQHITGDRRLAGSSLGRKHRRPLPRSIHVGGMQAM